MILTDIHLVFLQNAKHTNMDRNISFYGSKDLGNSTKVYFMKQQPYINLRIR